MAARTTAPTTGTTPTADHRIVVLHGAEAFLRMEWTRRLLAALRERFGEVDELRFPGTTPVVEVLDEARSLSLLSAHKAIIVDEADQFLQGEDRRRAMERYAEAPADGATLLLRSDTWRPGNFDKAVARAGIVMKCDVATDADAARWAMSRCQKRHHATIATAAAALLIERIGADLGRLDSELAKLALAANTAAGAESGGEITRTLVATLVGVGREEQAWAIQEPVLARDAAAAARMVGELLDVARVPDALVSWSLLDLARKLAEATERFGAGESEREVASALRLWGPSGNALLRVARSVPLTRLRDGFALAVATDKALKSGSARDPRRALEALAIQLSAF